MVAGLGLLAAGFLTIPSAATVLWLAVPLGIASVGRGVSQPALMSLVSKRASRDQRGSVMGTFQGSASLARVVGPLLAGASYDLWHPVPFYLAGCFVAVAFLLSLTVEKVSGTEIIAISA